jgi:hypothetical protein
VAGLWLEELKSEALSEPEKEVHSDDLEWGYGTTKEWEESASACLHIVWRGGYVGFKSTERILGRDRAVFFRRTIEGTCPACHGRISKDISPLSSRSVLLARLRKAKKQPAAERSMSIYVVECNCVRKHKNAAKGVFGCGALGGVRAETYPAELNDHLEWTQAVEPAELTPKDVAADEWIEQARQEELTRVRALAQQSVGIFTAVAGLLTIGTIIGADDVIRALQSPWSWIYLGFGMSALALASLAVFIGSGAAGLREVRGVSPDVQGRLGTRQTVIGLARKGMRVSQILAVAAIIALAVSFGVRYGAPLDKKVDPTEVKIVGVSTASPTPAPGSSQ